MKLRYSKGNIILLAAGLLSFGAGFAGAGVSRVIQERYRKNYENKALFLKIPIFSEKQYVFISGATFRHDPPPPGNQIYKLGDQLRVLEIDFGGDEIKFKLGPIANPSSANVELVFKFDSPLQEDFPNSGVFDRALGATFTEGLKYTDLEDAKRLYVEQEFERAARGIAASSGTSRDAVMKYVAPQLPAYQEAVREVESLQNRIQDLGKQLTQAQSEIVKLETESKTQQAENSRLRSQAASLQEKIDNSTSQLTRLGEDLRNAKGASQSYQRELANLQRSLKIRVDTNRDLAAQIAELGEVMQKIRKDNETLQGQNTSLHSDLDRAKSDNARLDGENQDLRTSVRQKDETIKTLSSKEDSLARQYITLKQAKDNLENVTLSVSSLRSRVIEEKTEGGVQSGKIGAYLGDIQLGTLEWRFPARLETNQEKAGDASFTMDSIDYVRVAPEERRILQSLGDPLKLRVTLVSGGERMEVTQDEESELKEISERESAAWNWRILNRGAQDTRLFLEARLVNKNGDEVPLLQSERLIVSSNMVRQVRNYVQPIPMALGAVLGGLLVGITGLFRRSRRPSQATTHTGAAKPSSYGTRKEL